MRTVRAAVIAAVFAASLVPGVARSSEGVRAGYGEADVTWHVGVGSGQYAAKDPNAANLVTGGEIDPHNHSNVQRHSYGVQSRLTYRALVVEGSNGKRVALVKSDSYLAQDMLLRRVAQILADGDSGIGYEQILLHVSHNHSSPYYFSPAWGVWLFQDVFEARIFEYHARQMAAAVEEAAAALRPARIGATTVHHTIYKGMIARQGIADDGTPRGYPETFGGEGGGGDFGVTVMRVDDMTDPEDPRPYAVWVNHGQHPESLDGYDLITADFLAPLERMVERDTGAPLVFSQGDVGSAEGPYGAGDPRYSGNEVLPDGVIRAWAHVGHAQTERGARYLADSIVGAWQQIARGDVPVPLSMDFPVDYLSLFVPGPVSHPYPSVSNCRTETTVEGNPGSPIIGLPDCERAGSTDRESMVWENLKEHGIPLPEHYDAPAFGAVEENLRLRLQVFRIGEIVLGSCACEAQNDIILNFESRTNDVPDDIWDGFDWTSIEDNCSQNEDTTWTCQQPSPTTFSDARYQRMLAQIHNDADGWDAPENAIAANAEPSDPVEIWGNFTKNELSEELGYALAVGVGHATDYNGYTVSYREYMAYDHYRKALTSYGPHTADYMATRLMRMAGFLKGDAALAPEPLDPVAQVDEARQVAVSTALGQFTSAAYDAWLASLPSDVGPAEALEQPGDVQRFGAATFTWRGGSNAVDNPIARVERLVDGEWQPYADQTGEVQTMVRFPSGAQGVVDTYTGTQEWLWTANFEAFDAWPRPVVAGGQTPDGTYRFVVDGVIRLAGMDESYHNESEPFDVAPWEGITVSDVQVVDGDVSFVVDPIVYPRTYSSGFRYIADDGNEYLCRTCSFRPWASSGEVESASVTIAREGGGVEVIAATLIDGRWVADANLAAGDGATIVRGGIVDSYGEINGVVVPVI